MTKQYGSTLNFIHISTGRHSTAYKIVLADSPSVLLYLHTMLSSNCGNAYQVFPLQKASVLKSSVFTLHLLKC